MKNEEFATARKKQRIKRIERVMTEQKHLGRIKLQPGLSLFCFDVKTGDITNMGRPRRVDVQEGCVYRVALNRKSFVKKLIRQGILKVMSQEVQR